VGDCQEDAKGGVATCSVCQSHSSRLRFTNFNFFFQSLGATVDLGWVFSTALETPDIFISCPVPLDSPTARQTAMMKFAIKKSLDSFSPSIWSADYASEALIPLQQAASSFPDGGQEGFVRWMKDRCSITQDESLQHHLGVDDVWKKLQNAFVILCPIIYYEPVMRKFLRELFVTLVEDGVR
jgi:adenosine deaminase CECR1